MRGVRSFSRQERLVAAESITLTALDPRAHNAGKATSKQDSGELFTQSSLKGQDEKARDNSP